MPRFARVVVPNCPHHVTQRGNERRDVFFTHTDREVYLGLTKQYSDLHDVQVLGFCLMTNHVHLILQPEHPNGLAKMMREVQMRYSQFRHALERGNGHLWQSRYYSCPVEPDRLASVMRYVELNPVRAKISETAEAYPWSSASVHLGAPDARALLTLASWSNTWKPDEWSAVLHRAERETHAIREATYGGRPLGSPHFIETLETTLQRPLKRGTPGRPKKTELNQTAAA
ncbi:MAG: transposase [Bryobacteraceae bacterium]